MECNICLMDITYSSSVDGTGFRDVLFVAGCPHRCEGCHNPKTWDFNAGKKVNCDEIFLNLNKSSITNVTFSGGEPFCQAEALLYLARRIKKETKKTIWIYSGYLFEEIILDKIKLNLLKECDVLVDGKFEKDKKGLNLKFKGSENQRIIDIKKSLKENKVILF
ncbi:MAG: anaerobic ribonucleoside-triphosphate reductase activating protein [Ruminococcaceae bacterium]|nr:anaerobic ribonucleoside-triphosphate reductase activating protein [Oscillospiraceae bacterium]